MRRGSEARAVCTICVGGCGMAWRVADLVIEGEIDNTSKGRVTGWIKLAGREDPATLGGGGGILGGEPRMRCRFRSRLGP